MSNPLTDEEVARLRQMLAGHAQPWVKATSGKKVTELVGVAEMDERGDWIRLDNERHVRMMSLLPDGVEGRRGRLRITVEWTPELLRLRRPLRSRRFLFVVRPLRAHPLQFLGGEVAKVQREPDARLRRRLCPASRRRDLVGHAAR